MNENDQPQRVFCAVCGAELRTVYETCPKCRERLDPAGPGGFRELLIDYLAASAGIAAVVLS